MRKHESIIRIYRNKNLWGEDCTKIEDIRINGKHILVGINEEQNKGGNGERENATQKRTTQWDSADNWIASRLAYRLILEVMPIGPPARNPKAGTYRKGKPEL